MGQDKYTRAAWLAALGALYASRALAQSTATGLTVDQTQQLGSVVWQKWKKKRGIAESPQSVRLDRYLQGICDKLAAHAPKRMSFQVHLDADPAFKSAIALPGNQVVVGAGILALVDSEDALAVVLGHELGHIENGDINADLLEIERTRHIQPGRLVDLPLDTLLKDHTNSQELAADRSGLSFAVASGYSPYGAVRLLKLFQYMARGNKPRPGTLTLEQRLDQMQLLIAKNHWKHLEARIHPLELPEPC